MYADYEYYTNTFHGAKIPDETTFNTYSVKSSSYIDYITLKRIDSETVINEVIKATCEIAELYYDQEILNNDQKNHITSESVGTHKITIDTSKKILTKNEMDKELYKIAHKHLFLTGLLYRGTC